MWETAKILQKKNKSWEAKWSSSQEVYKPRSGRPTGLDRTAEKVTEKAKYKKGNFTRKISKQLKNKSLPYLQQQCGDTCQEKDGIL